MARCDRLGAISDEPGRLARSFHSPAMQRANALVGSWMREAGLEVREDAAFNLLGRWPSSTRGVRTLLLGSHLDTVRDAGKYDGPLGVLVALAAVTHLRESGLELPFHVEIAGFSDEEGLRYQTTYLGSRALAGTLTAADLARVEERGLRRARRRAGEFIGYIETHIEQGPVLQNHELPVGIVTAIAGADRIRVEFQGRAGHAGTTPMTLRLDALCGAAELVLAAERCGVVATVGQMGVEPGAPNVIPGRVVLSLDVRHGDDGRRERAVQRLEIDARTIAATRGLRVRWEAVQRSHAVRCDRTLTALLVRSVRRAGVEPLKLASGAGHDAVALSVICPVAMLFVRCKDGISHHPAESVKREDVECAIAVIADAVAELARSRRAGFGLPSKPRKPRKALDGATGYRRRATGLVKGS
jgi:allantoate deiminase